ncbi:MAG: glycosyltransferase [Verrucomicrobiae bacterium]|nr:glycosyltransferase [Verrucomicrobiae bacterium]
MNILFISMVDALPWSGGEPLWVWCAEALLQRNIQVAFSYKHWMPTPEPLLRLEKLGACALYREIPDNPCLVVRGRRKLRRIHARKTRYRHFTIEHWLLTAVIESDADLVIITPPSAYALKDIALPLECLQNEGILYFILSQIEDETAMLSSEVRTMLRRIYGKALGVAFGSTYGKSLLERQLASDIPNGYIFDNPINSSGRIVAWPNHETALHMACVGRLDVLCKGQDRLLSALAGEMWRDRNWRLTCYGEGPDRSYLEALSRYYKIHSRVRFPGHIDNVEKIWAQEHVFVQPSPKEGTPMSVVEAMFAGRSGVVTRVGRMPDLIRDGVTGWIADCSIDSIQQALERMWNERGHLRDKTEAIHSFISGYWNRHYNETFADMIIAMMGKTSREQ